MKKHTKLLLSSVLSVFFMVLSCSDDDGTQSITPAITLSSNVETLPLGESITFEVMTHENQNVTTSATYLVNNTILQSNVFTPQAEGQYTAKATYSLNGSNLTSNMVTFTVTEMLLTSIEISAASESIEIGDTFTFSVIGNNGADVTSDATYYINDAEISGNEYTPEETGTYEVKATYMHEGTLLETEVLSLEVLYQSTEVTVFDEVVFYDGYAATVSEPVPAGVIRKNNASNVTKLTQEAIDLFSDELTMQVTIGALCDNYDRIGGVYLNLVPSGTEFSTAAVEERIEIGRFITPFMNKNVQPTEVPYEFEVDNLALLFNDPVISSTYDFWIELYVFGVPYAAQTEVAGCAGRIDTFLGTLKFVSTDKTYEHVAQHLEPIAASINVNNYNSNGTDVLGETTKTFTFEIEENLSNAKIHLITSNHGAGTGGEEYVRREHFIYFDNSELDMYMPGGKSCEPYRQYNTQGNGIYTGSPKSEAWWTAWNNWCPGDVIPIRTYELGALSQGTHSFKIEVPDAEFVGGDGKIPVSVYIQGDIN
ncbi:peptide-N-glycosidase F-related protein [Mangrovimonas sp. YM274]|uniref:peptide-N-glycosidase F-related protein n=1 Tax=Mangrovimonas sp. YM274 TaxID=3070660 RepID=UPI0027DC24C7|nr:peptide-N-glycosidase F-related protein [Mangrovimonas sp. YM274]WMI67724.1 peptide-N-glycosidase F-related protein [Mangrovimonas sp. YM274]